MFQSFLMLNINMFIHREWTCEECTNGLVQIATIFVQQTYIDDIIAFLQVENLMVMMWKMIQLMKTMKMINTMKMMKMIKIVKMTKMMKKMRVAINGRFTGRGILWSSS